MGSNTVIPGVTYTWDQLSSFAQDGLNLVAKNLNLTSTNFSIASGSNVGDGFMSVMQRVVIEGFKVNDSILEKGVKHKISVLMKLPPTSKERREQFASSSLFEREIIMYQDYLLTLERFQIEKGIQRYEGFFNFPKCYYANYQPETEEAILILEDLAVSDLVMWNKFQPTDIFHANKVMEGLGHLHGLSFVLKKQEPVLFKKYQQYNDHLVDILIQDHVKEMWENYFGNAIAAFSDKPEVQEKLKKFKENIADELTEMLNPENAEPYAIVNHGDCWINNFMFKQGADKQPTFMAFIDFQVARYVSPVLDLMYFIFVSTDKPLRDAHYENLLQTYYSSLSHIIRRCGEDSEVLFPYEAFREQLIKFGRFGIPMAFMLVPMISSKPDELADMDQISEALVKFKRTGVKSQVYIEMEEKYQKTMLLTQERTRDVVIDMINYGYF